MIETRSLVTASATFEVGAGLALLGVPSTAVRLLLGTDLRGSGLVATRACGLALLALGVACRPARHRRASTRAVRVLLGYNTLAAVGLSLLRAFGRYRGAGLVPAMAVHAVFAGLLAGRARATAAR